MTQITDTVARVLRAIETGNTEEIEFLFNRALCVPSDGEELLHAVSSCKMEENWRAIWLTSIYDSDVKSPFPSIEPQHIVHPSGN